MSRLRALPLVALVAVTVTAALVRARHRVASPGAHVPPPPVERALDAGAGLLAASGALPADAGVAIAPVTLHGDLHRTHRALGRGPRAAHVAWTADVGGPVEAQVTTSADESTLYVASLGGTLTALARDTGKVRWTVSLGNARAYATPSVAPSGVIYAGSDAKRLYAVLPEGTIRWQLELDDEVDTGPALLPDGRVVVAAGKTLYLVRPGGDIAWRTHVKGKIFTAPAVLADGSVVVGAQDHHAYRVGSDGKVVFDVDLGADVDGAPAVTDDETGIYFGTDAGEVVRLDAKGAVRWRTQLGGFVRGPLSVARGGDVLAGVYGPTPRQVRVRGDDGALLGAFPVQGTGAREFGVHGGALEDEDGVLYFGAQDDFVYAVDRAGTLRWKFHAGDDVDAPLTLLHDGSLVVAADDGKVVLLTGER